MIESLVTPVAEWLINKGSDKVKEFVDFQHTRITAEKNVLGKTH
jgi:hypothetical protein